MLFRKVPNSPGSSSHILKSLLTEEGILWFSDKREKITYKVEAGCFFLSDSNVRTSNVHKTMLTHLFLCNLIWKMNFHPQYSQLGASVMWLWRPQLCFLGLLVLKLQAWCFINIISPIQFVSGFVYLFIGVWDLSSPARDWTCGPCTAGWILHHWATREIPA